jgi:hypothetical protein
MAAYLQRRAWDEREPSFVLWALWKKRLKLQAHSRFTIQDGCGLPVATGGCHEPTPVNPSLCYVASLAQAGRIDEARAALARLQKLHPDNSIARIERNVPYTDGPMAKFLEGFRKAGLQ